MAGRSVTQSLRIHDTRGDIGGFITITADVTITGTSKTAATFSATITGIGPGSATVQVDVTNNDKSVTKGKSVIVSSGESSSTGTVTGLTMRDVTAYTGGDSWTISLSCNSVGTNITFRPGALWTEGSGGSSGSGSTSTSNYRQVFIGCAGNVYGGTAYQTFDGTLNTKTWGYVTGGGKTSNQTTTYGAYAYDYIRFTNEATTNYVTVFANGTMKYKGVTYTAVGNSHPSDGYNYTFMAWNQYCTEQRLSAWTTVANGGTIYFGAWFQAPTPYAVSYNVNGGSGSVTAQTQRFNVPITLKTYSGTRAGYKFAGWGLASTSKVAAYQPSESFCENTTTTLYAVWWKCAYIYNGSAWKTAVPYIYKNSTDGWVRAMPYVYSSGWK